VTNQRDATEAVVQMDRDFAASLMPCNTIAECERVADVKAGRHDSHPLIRQAIAYRLASLPAAIEQEPVAWRTEYRDVYRGRDSGWNYHYCNTKPGPCRLQRAPNGFDGFTGHRNVTPLYAHPAPSDQEKLIAAFEELEKIAEQVGEVADPFAAWEAIDAMVRQRDAYAKQLAIYRDAIQNVVRCTSGSHAVAIAHEANARARQTGER
jgi:hypothetical protein